MAAGVAMLATACGGGGGSSNASGSSGGSGSNGGGPANASITLHECQPQNPLIPGDTNETCGQHVVDYLFRGLVTYDAQGNTHNVIAKSIKTKDSQHYTITIKNGWKWQDGTPVTAKDFVRAWNYTAYAPNAQLDANYLSHIKGYNQVNPPDPDGDGPQKAPKPTAKKMSGLKMVNKHTFKVTLSKPFSVFPISLAYGAFDPLPPVFFKEGAKKFGKHPVGNGPYQLVSYTPRQQIKLKRFDGFGGKNTSNVENVTMKIYQDDNAAYRDLVSGNLDFFYQVPDNVLKNDRWQKQLGKSNTKSIPLNATQTISFALYDKNLPTSKSADLRHAISMATNRQQINKTLFNGSRPPADGWAPPGVNGYVKNACQGFCQFNPKKAKALWKKAGGPQKVKSLSISYNADAAEKKLLEVMCQSITNTLGVKCVAKPVVDFATLRDEIQGQKIKGMFRSGWIQDYPSIQDFLEPIFTNGATANDTKYNNPKFDKLIAEGNQAPNLKQANKYYQKAEALLAKDMPSIPIYFYRQESAWSKRLSNVQFNHDKKLDLTKVHVNS
jgi:oligopeptide transport system substrate-binding protein